MGEADLGLQFSSVQMDFLGQGRVGNVWDFFLIKFYFFFTGNSEFISHHFLSSICIRNYNLNEAREPRVPARRTGLRTSVGPSNPDASPSPSVSYSGAPGDGR